MAYPTTDPLRLQVLDRVVEVLNDIRPSTTYFYAPDSVLRRMVSYDEMKGSLCYMVSTDTGGTIEAVQDLYVEDFYINVKCWVNDKDDPGAMMERALSDVRHAINADTLPTAGTGSLAEMDALVFFDEPPTTDNGYLSLEGYAFFEQRIKIQVHGTWQ